MTADRAGPAGPVVTNSALSPASPDPRDRDPYADRPFEERPHG